MKRVTLIVALLVFVSLPAQAAPAVITASFLVKAPVSDQVAYVGGVIDAMMLVGLEQLKGPVVDWVKHVVVDAPKGATLNQLTEIAMRYLKDHPEKWHLSAAEVVREALWNHTWGMWDYVSAGD